MGATILAASVPEAVPAAYDPAEPKKPWDDYQDYGHNHWHNSLIWGEGIHDVAILGPGLIWGKGLSRGGSEEPRLKPQGMGNKAIALKNCHNVMLRRFLNFEGRSVRHPGDRGGQPDDRQPEDRYRPGRNGYRLLPQRARVQLQREFALGRWHLPEELVCTGLCARHRECDDYELLCDRRLRGRDNAGRNVQAMAG